MEILKELEQFAKQYNLPIIGARKGEVLVNVIKEHNPKKILEIGTLIGYSAILMANYLKNGKITTIEINNKYVEIAKENFKKAKFSNINLITGNALNIIPRLKEKFDMLFLDAAKEEYYRYLKRAEPKLNKNAIIVADNVGIFGIYMKDFLDYVRNSGKYVSKTYYFGFDAVEVSRRV